MPLSPVDDAQARLGDLMLTDLRRYMSDRLRSGDKRPMLVLVDEFPQLVTGSSDPGDTAGSLFETSRSAGMGLALAAQSIAGLSGDETNRRRALSSGAALIIGRSKDPEHAYAIRPQEVREAWDGAFWLVQAGGVHPFRAMPAATKFVVDEPAHVQADTADVLPLPVVDQSGAVAVNGIPDGPEPAADAGG